MKTKFMQMAIKEAKIRVDSNEGGPFGQLLISYLLNIKIGDRREKIKTFKRRFYPF